MQLFNAISSIVPSQDIKQSTRVETPFNLSILKSKLRESLRTISPVNPEKNKMVMILGAPGAGKSSVINYFLGWELDEYGEEVLKLKDSDKNKERLQGCEFKVREHKKIKKKFIKITFEKDKSFFENFEKKPILAKMGTASQAVTTMPTVYRNDEAKLAYCDCPGIGNTGGDSQEQVVAATLATVLAAKSGGVKAIIVLVNGTSLKPSGGRGRQVREVFDFLLKFMKVSKDEILRTQNIMQSIFFIFNNIEPNEKDLKEKLNKLGKTSQDGPTQELMKYITQDNNFHRVMIVDPKDNGTSKIDILKKIEASPGIKPLNFTFPTNSSNTLQQFEDEF